MRRRGDPTESATERYRWRICDFPFSICDWVCCNSIANRKSKIANAFTLTEILIVIGLIVLLIAIAVPAFNLISGGKSIQGARNQISAALGRARAEAIGKQRTTGVMFFVDPRSGRTNCAIVADVKATNAGLSPLYIDAWLDIVEDADFLPLPPGVSLQTLCDSTIAANARTSDGYLGYNERGSDPNVVGYPSFQMDVANGTARYGGVILFDSAGRLTSSTYAFRRTDSTGALTRMGSLLKLTTAVDLIPPPTVVGTVVTPLTSQFGFVMYETQLFQSQANFSAEDPKMTGAAYATTEKAEEDWMDANASPVLINRYAGTLVKGPNE